jgi:hypothetical protein
MKLTITCQTCGKILSVIEKDQITQDDIMRYEAGSFCDTVSGTENILDDQNNVIGTVDTYDGIGNIQATMTQE